MLATLNGEPDDSERDDEVFRGLAEIELHLALQDDTLFQAEIEATEALLRDDWNMPKALGETALFDGPLSDVVPIDIEDGFMPNIKFPPQAM